MSRQRFIYPETFTSDDFTSLSIEARLLFIGIFATADDYGRGKASTRALKAAVFPSDPFTLDQVLGWRTEIVSRGMVTVYETAGVECYEIPKWAKYQSPRWKKASLIPSNQSVPSTCGGPPADLSPIGGTREEKSIVLKRGEEKRSEEGLGRRGEGSGEGSRQAPPATPPNYKSLFMSAAAKAHDSQPVNGANGAEQPMQEPPEQLHVPQRNRRPSRRSNRPSPHR